MKISVQVKTNSRQGNKLVKVPDGSFVVYLKARPVDGQANKELISFLAEHFSVPKTHIKILRGTASRFKIIQIGQD